MEYEVVVGLEVHAELSTQTKIYCSCKNEFGAEVNTKVCPICMGMPGTLPTLNKKVVDYAVKMGLALGCQINRISKQDRKNYFYPDLPKAYQISQFDIPLCEHGHVDIVVDQEGHTKRIGVTRIHIEEDAGKLLHDESFSGSLVDMNRCGVPLIEIVSEPDLRSPEEAKAYLDAIRSILQYLDVSDCKMQEGSIRCDVNVSVMPKGSDAFGTRCEMKNVNSFSGTMRAIAYEAKRQIAILEAGGEIHQETRRWDDLKGESVLLRSKEDAQDYRYFPEPDLGTLVLTQEHVQQLKDAIPELPGEKVQRYLHQNGLPLVEAELLAENPEKSAFFDACVELRKGSVKAISNWLLGDLSKILNEKNLTLAQLKLTPKKLVDMIALIEEKTISNTAGKTVLDVIAFEDKTAAQVVQEQNLAQISDNSALEAIVTAVLAANEKSVADYKKGKTNAIGYLVGQCMRQSKGQGNPSILRELLEKALAE